LSLSFSTVKCRDVKELKVSSTAVKSASESRHESADFDLTRISEYSNI
jgi:hypothetical protein